MTPATPTALFVSPHLDDAAFSATRTMLALAKRGWRVVMATALTQSVAVPKGFALRCQTDKGIDPDVDYMAVRRDEDHAFIRELSRGLSEQRGADDIDATLGTICNRFGDLPEAPHRGYESAAELFSRVRDDDALGRQLDEFFIRLVIELEPSLCFGPLGYGRHVDHVQVIRSLDRVMPASVRRAYYRDTPYVLRADPGQSIVGHASMNAYRIGATESDKRLQCDAIAKYETQLPFQFGGVDAMRRTMKEAIEILYSPCPEPVLGDLVGDEQSAKRTLMNPQITSA